eukprot:1177019-Prorocentrum_minimum.AAC.3
MPAQRAGRVGWRRVAVFMPLLRSMWRRIVVLSDGTIIMYKSNAWMKSAPQTAWSSVQPVTVEISWTGGEGGSVLIRVSETPLTNNAPDIAYHRVMSR